MKIKILSWRMLVSFIILTILIVLTIDVYSQTVVVNPTSPWVVPACVNSIKVEVWGGGGAGGGCNNTGWPGANSSYGSGGGGGAYKVATFPVSAGQNYSITIGLGGTGSSDANGTSGTMTTVSGPGGSVSANPGAGGAKRGGTPGSGGTDGFNNGGNGGQGSGNGAGGGGGAGNNTPSGTGNGGNGSNNAAGAAGAGALPGGSGGLPQTGNGDGNQGSEPGGGGGGGKQSFWNGAKAGGAGAAGKVVITYTVVSPPEAPVVSSPVEYCTGETPSQLSATGSNLLWYDVPTGGTGSSTAPTPSTNVPGTYLFYVSQTNICEGPRAMIEVIVYPTPVASVSAHSDISCYGGSDGSITIEGLNGIAPYQYSVDNGESWVPSPDNPYTIGGLNANEPFRIKIKDSKGCESR